MTISDQTKRRGAKHWHVGTISVLLTLFVFRAAAQLIQSLKPTTLLPPFAAWYSGTVSYAMLVPVQVLIVAAGAVLIVRMHRHSLKPNRRLGIVLLMLGAAYMLGAVFRLVAGLTFLSDIPFFAASLPAFFHIVLAGIVLTFADFHFRG
jgi:hypothetical protein